MLEVWHYKHANTELITQVISRFNKQRAFLNTSVRKKLIFLILLASLFRTKLQYVIRIGNTQKSSKACWPLLKVFLNKNKTPILPFLFYQNCFVADFKEKPELFNSFFSKPCSLILNNSLLYSDNFRYITDKHLPTVTFTADDTRKTIKNLNSNKAHENENISIRMLKICDDFFVHR